MYSCLAWIPVTIFSAIGRGLARMPADTAASGLPQPALKQYVRDGVERCRCSFRASDIEDKIEPLVLAAFGDKYFPEIIELPTEDHTADLAEVEEAIAELETDRYERGPFKGDAGSKRYAAMMERLEAKAEALRVLPQLPARQEVVLSDELFHERWASLESDHERGALLHRMRVGLLAFHDQYGQAKLWLRQSEPRRAGDQEADKLPTGEPAISAATAVRIVASSRRG